MVAYRLHIRRLRGPQPREASNMTSTVEKTTSAATAISTDPPAAVTDPTRLPTPSAQLRDAIIAQVSARHSQSALEELIAQHPHILDASDFSCDEEDLAILEEALGSELPEDLKTLLMFSDGGFLRSPLKMVQLAPIEQLVMWVEQGVVEQFGSMPFATDDTGALLVVDTTGDYGGGEGAVYRLERRLRGAQSAQVHSATRLGDSIGEFLGYLAAGRDAC